MSILQSLGAFIISAAMAISGFLGYHQPVADPAPLGAALPGATAVFETSLASPITSSATSMTLSANAIRGGGSVSGYNCFTVDEGSAQAETICGTVSGTSVTGLTRGLSQATGTTTVSALQFSHRRGANVKITDFPVIQILKAQNNGEDTFPNILNYTSHPTFTGTTNIVDKKYVDDTAFSGAGVIDATEAAKGVIELATTLEQASSTTSGSSGPLVVQAKNATSTYNSATAALRVVVTQNNGKIDNYFLATTTLFANSALTGSSTFNGYAVGGQPDIQIFTGNGTWTKPSYAQHVRVVMIGGGGAGGAGCTSSSKGGGGGGGGFIDAVLPASLLTSTVSVTVGSGGTGGTVCNGDATAGGTTSFGSYLQVTGGAQGALGSSGGSGGGGAGGVGAYTGGAGAAGNAAAANTGLAPGGGNGGASGGGGNVGVIAGRTGGANGNALPGASANANEPTPGAGGGGGDSAHAGGAGGIYGGGGGGGFNGGNGGAGGAGIAYIITYR